MSQTITAFDLVVQQLPQLKPQQIKATLNLLEDGNTVPFIARYRKEMTGALDEVQIKTIFDTHQYLQNLMKRKEEILRLIDEQDKLTDDLVKSIEKASKMQQLEDIYRPYKQKRRTKATIAKEKGLEPLAVWLMGTPISGNAELEASQYINPEHNIVTSQDALDGAHEIMAEMISDDPKYREFIRRYIKKYGYIETVVKNEELDEKHVYEMYYQFSQPITKVKAHQILAINRAEKEDVIKVNVTVDTTKIFDYLNKQLVQHQNSSVVSYVVTAYIDSYKRFIYPSIDREIRHELTELSDTKAIEVFGENLKNLLLQPPMKEHIVLGLDPAYRTGCKLAIVDETGRVLTKSVIYPHKPASEIKRQEAGHIFRKLVEDYNVTMIAIGNGTASRESELFVAEQLKKIHATVHYVIVNEAGASVYSASELARLEFPDYQVEERSAVSIARRLQDPLAELVKIDPKSVGVGQYQHDVSQKQLENQLSFVVETVVNQVGVNLNTASVALLQHVAGMNKTIATNIVAYRDEHGAFKDRMTLKQVKRLGPKAFEQAVGFLRIIDGDTVLDNTQIHPETYEATYKLLDIANVSLNELGTPESIHKLKQLNLTKVMAMTDIGKETLQDIMDALEKPGRDIRDTFAAPILRQDVLSMEDLKIGMELQGTVRNVVDFGAFVDIGVKQDGLVHLSKMSHKFVRSASDIVSVGNVITVWIEAVDLKKQRISLSMLPLIEKQ